MSFLPIILAAEIIFASLTLNFSHANNVLGIQLAQSDTGDSNQNEPLPAESSPSNNASPSEASPAPAIDTQTSTQPSSAPQDMSNSQAPPSNNQTNQNPPVNQESSGLNPQSLPSDSGSPPDSPSVSSPYDISSNTTENPSYFNDIINSSSTNETAQPTNTESQTSSEQPTSTETTVQPTNPQVTNESSQPDQQSETVPTPNQSYPNQTASVLDPNDLLNSVENINQQSIEEVKKEEDEISQTAEPADKTKLLINFAADKVKDMNNSIKNDDFASTNFASQRFNEQIDKAVDHLQNLPLPEQKKLQKQLVNFCSQTDYVLKTAELSVPEEAEQDLEINRAKCLNIQQ